MLTISLSVFSEFLKTKNNKNLFKINNVSKNIR